jgi:hypothetical protein
MKPWKKNTFKKKYREIRSYEVESLTNQMSNVINKNKSITQKNLKNKSEKKTLIKVQLEIWFDMRFVAGRNFSFSKTTWVYSYFDMFFFT